MRRDHGGYLQIRLSLINSYGRFYEFCCTTNSSSDVLKAYVQSWLETAHPMSVELLCKSLYGHPASGGHWAKKFRCVAKELGGSESTTRPSWHGLRKSVGL